DPPARAIFRSPNATAQGRPSQAPARSRIPSGARDARQRPSGPPPREGLVENARYAWGFLRDPIAFVSRRFEAYGDVYFVPGAGPGARKGPGLFVLRHPDHLHEVLVQRTSSFGKTHSAFRSLSRFLG